MLIMYHFDLVLTLTTLVQQGLLFIRGTQQSGQNPPGQGDPRGRD